MTSKLGELISEGDLRIWCSFHNLGSLPTIVNNVNKLVRVRMMNNDKD